MNQPPSKFPLWLKLAMMGYVSCFLLMLWSAWVHWVPGTVAFLFVVILGILLFSFYAQSTLSADRAPTPAAAPNPTGGD